ncbi:cytochrome P450 [Mycobacterium intracellulare]|uniref:cytochrome P450 n=1 Tax=Mycobacterium intracellulare TaxID=1767 RepID=UPI001EEF701F|nr:cytochrome P450 [Mycobacterium intracellulare]MEE3753034.1 cytochrome P450 [Mycobacterium intracellulare]
MQTTTDPQQSAGFYESAPMALDRSAGWRYVRERGDVFEADGMWYLTSLEAVRFAQHHPEIFSSAGGYDVGSPIPMVPLMIDPPDHARYRRLLDPMLSPRVINGIEDNLREQAAQLVKPLADKGQCDVITDIAELFPTQVLLTLFGLPVADRDKFRVWSDTLTSDAAKSEATQAQLEAGAALLGYLQEHVSSKRSHPGSDDMIGHLLAVSEDEGLNDLDILGMCFLFVLAALDTTTGAIGFTMYHLARRPDLRRAVIDDPALITPLVEEILRLELPAPMVPRRTTQDVEVAGVTIPAGSKVHICMATANREGSDGSAPDDIDLSAAGRGHLSFGGGIHRCLGSHLARRELRLIVEEFHARISDYEIPDGYEPRIAWPTGTYHLESLPLVFGRGR